MQGRGPPGTKDELCLFSLLLDDGMATTECLLTRGGTFAVRTTEVCFLKRICIGNVSRTKNLVEKVSSVAVSVGIPSLQQFLMLHLK